MTIRSNETDEETLASYLVAALDRPDMCVCNVARALGHPDPSFLLAVANKARRMQLDAVPDLADVLGVDRLWLLALAMRDYSPSLASVLASYCATMSVSRSSSCIEGETIPSHWGQHKELPSI